MTGAEQDLFSKISLLGILWPLVSGIIDGGHLYLYYTTIYTIAANQAVQYCRFQEMNDFYCDVRPSYFLQGRRE